MQAGKKIFHKKQDAGANISFTPNEQKKNAKKTKNM